MRFQKIESLVLESFARLCMVDHKIDLKRHSSGSVWEGGTKLKKKNELKENSILT